MTFVTATDLTYDDESELGELSDVISMPCPHADSIRKLWEMGRPRNVSTPEDWSVKICYYSLSEPTTIDFYHGEQIFSYDVDLIGIDDPEHPGTAVILDSQWIDPLIPKDWYSECLDEHGPECNEPNWTKLHAGTNARPDWLIDVVDQCIVPFTSDTGNYVTLSYTWGRVQCLKTTSANFDQLRQPGSIRLFQAQGICQTVQDAIGITKHLGERFLWVDSLCIIQDDDESLRRNINVMHQIYANSSLCLVAFAGTDANHGLRGLEGISAPRCVEHIALGIAGGEMLSCLKRRDRTKNIAPDAEDDRVSTIEGSAYNDRGWTYQEFIFAKRRLVFTDGPLRWICGSAKYGEETWGDLKRDGWTSGMEDTDCMDEIFPSFYTLELIAPDYNTRYFTYQPDVLKGFLGIQTHLNGVFHGGLNYGHPEMFFDISLAWISNPGMKRRLVSAGMSPEADELPSWSWMGWRGRFGFIGDGEYSTSIRDGFTEPVAEWFSMESPSPSMSNMKLVNCKWHHYKTLFEKDPTQVPDGWKVDTAISGPLPCRVVSETQLSSRYPVPVPSPTDNIQPLEQRKFLFSKTSRCHFATRPAPSMERWNWFDGSIGLYSADGKFAGFLQLPHLQVSELDRLLAIGKAELVAVAKGWTVDVDDFLLAVQEQEKLMAGESLASASASQQPTFGRFDEQKTRHKCYFVLCIQWENGVAKRQGSGKVLAEVWERNQEPVDLVLG